MGKHFPLWLLQGGLLLIPLAYWPSLHEPYETGKWLVFYAIAILTVGWLWLGAPKKLQLPTTEVLWLVALLATYSIAIFWNAHKSYGRVLLDWSSFLAIAFTAFVFVSTNAHWFRNLRNTLHLSALLVCLVSLGQHFFGY